MVRSFVRDGRGIGRIAFIAMLPASVWFGATAQELRAQSESEWVRAPHAAARLLADQATVAPGRPLRLAVEFDLDKDWHIYWATAGEPFAPAMPTTFTVTAPNGFDVGRPLFPTPHRHQNELGDLYILEGKPVVLFEVTTPDTVSDNQATFKVDARWLACRESCVPGDAKLSVTLPVAAKGDAARPAHQAIFDRAAAARPVSVTKSKYVGVSGGLEPAALHAGGKATMKLKLTVANGHHIQAHDAPEGLIAADLFLEPTNGLDWGAVTYPNGVKGKSTAGEETSEYSGVVELTAPVTVSEEGVGTAKSIHGVLRYQACTDAGTCFPPETVEFSVAIGDETPADDAGRVAATAGEATSPTETPVDSGRNVQLKKLADTAYVTVLGAADRESLAPAETFDIRFAVEIADDHHIQGYDAEGGFIPAKISFDPGGPVEAVKIDYPKSHERKDPVLGVLKEYTGRIEITAHVRAAESLTGERAVIKGAFGYQACTDDGTCFPPEKAEFTLTLPVRGGGSAAIAAPPSDAATIETPAGPAVAGAMDGRNAAGNSATGGISGALTSIQAYLLGWGVAGYLILAFMGGFVLNFMPCVLPVISLKVLSFVRQAQEDPWRVAMLGMSFALGIEVSFLILGAMILILSYGWGSIFQSPGFTIALAAFVTAMAMSLFGLFTLNAPQSADQLGAKVSGEGPVRAFGMGLLATVLGTACTAPFLSLVISIAVSQPRTIGFAIFAVAGAGMAIPYVILTMFPQLMRFVPRAGPWMLTFERVMGFVLLATVIWLLNAIPKQLTGSGLLMSLILLLFVALAAWLYGRVEFGAPMKRRVTYYSGAAAALVMGWCIPFVFLNTWSGLRNAAKVDVGSATGTDFEGRYYSILWGRPVEEIPWQPYSPERVERAVSLGFTVFVDYTADWCASCKTNESTSLNIDETRRLMSELGVIPFKADYTNPRDDIAADLKRYGRSGVPMYLVYAPEDTESAKVLPELLTPGIVQDALRTASAGNGEKALAHR